MVDSKRYKEAKKMKEKCFTEVAGFILTFLIERNGNNFLDKRAEKKKIVKILHDDGKNIRRIFNTTEGTDLYNLIEEYMMYNIFKKADFYSSEKLDEEQENKLWEDFSNYMRNEGFSNYIDKDCKEKIIYCVNRHNEAIDNIILDASGRFGLKIVEKQHKSLERQLKQIEKSIDTLSLETPLQDHDEELDFSIEQLESIMKSYRFDIKQFRLFLITILGSLFLFFFLTVIIMLVLLKSIYVHFVLWGIIFVVWIMLSIAVYFFIYQKSRLTILERKLDEKRDLMWDINYKLYVNQITTKYQRHYEKKSDD